MTEEIRIVTPLGMLGYGFPEESFAIAMEARPHVIAFDSGSTDAGPHKLGKGVGIVSRRAMKRDLAIVLKAGREHDVPVIVGSSGGSGAHAHLTWTADIVAEILGEMEWPAKVALIHADITSERVLSAHESGDLQPLRAVPDIDVADISACNSIVAQMGPEPVISALEHGAEVILAGRAYDPAVIAALPIARGADPGLALHMGKIMECGAQCAIPGAASDCMIGVLSSDSFVLTPAAPERRCTPTSVAAHTLYEKSDPAHLPGPGGVLDLEDCTFEAIDDRSVRVRGSRFIADEAYRVKLEGVLPEGFRSISVVGVRDPIMLSVLDECLDHAKDAVRWYGDAAGKVDFIVYGRNGVLPQNPVETPAEEVGIVIEAIADSQEAAAAACSLARSSLLHYHYTGRKSTSGNLAFPFSPSDLDVGPTFRFALYHTMSVADPCELFPVSYLET